MENTERKQVFEFLSKTQMHRKNNKVFAVIKQDQFEYFKNVAKSFLYKGLTAEHLTSFLKGDCLELPINELLSHYGISEEFLDLSND